MTDQTGDNRENKALPLSDQQATDICRIRSKNNTYDRLDELSQEIQLIYKQAVDEKDRSIEELKDFIRHIAVHHIVGNDRESLSLDEATMHLSELMSVADVDIPQFGGDEEMLSKMTMGGLSTIHHQIYYAVQTLYAEVLTDMICGVKSFDPRQYSDVGKTVEVLDGDYEVAEYSVEGPAHSDEYVHVSEGSMGLLISTEHEEHNIVVNTNQGRSIIILVPKDKYVPFELQE